MSSVGAGGDDCGGDGDGVRLPRSSRGSGDGALTTMASPFGSVQSWSRVSWVDSTSVQEGIFSAGASRVPPFLFSSKRTVEYRPTTPISALYMLCAANRYVYA